MVINIFAVAKMLAPTVNALAIMALIPAAYSIITGTPGFTSFAGMALFALLVGNGLKLLGLRSGQFQLTIRELFIFTASMWVITALICSIPLYFLLDDVDWPGSIFESASALSTTGVTVINNIESRPPTVILWRSMLQLLGGIGFVVIAVAVLPQVAMGGMNIFKTESNSFENSNKFTPHVKTMSLAVIGWYMVLLTLCTTCYMIGGLNFFIAFNTAACTVATGGMMPLDNSMNGLSPIVHYSAAFFMFLASCPFLVIIAGLTGNIRKLYHDQQIRGYTMLVIILTTLVFIVLYFDRSYDLERAFRVALFNVISVLSTSAFGLEDFTAWHPFTTLLFFIFLPLGGCSGSTSGGIKMFRIQICASLFKTQMIKSLHPHRVIAPQFNGHQVDYATVHAIITYIAAYILMVFLSSMLATLMGLNILDAFTGSISCLSNVGPSFGPELNPSQNYNGQHSGVLLLFAFDMMLGRLEIIPVLLCMTRFFWKY